MRSVVATAVIAVALVAMVLLLPTPRAEAQSLPVVAVAQALPAVGPGVVDSFAIACTSAAAVAILPPSGAEMLSYECINESTTMVAVGDNDIPDPGTTREGPVFCAQGGSCPTAAKAVFGGNVRKEFCRGDTDTTVRCRAMTAALEGP